MANIQFPDLNKPADLEMRVAQFAARVIAVCEALPKRIGSEHLRDQLFRASTSVAANYAEACVPESRKDFAHKINIALKELVESRMWLRIIAMKQYIDPKSLQKLLAETDELVNILHTSVKRRERTWRWPRNNMAEKSADEIFGFGICGQL